jgi:hypothetical protein
MFDWIADTVFNRSQRRLYKELQAAKPLFWSTLSPFNLVSYRLTTINAVDHEPVRWKACVLVIDENGFTIYPHSQKMDVKFTLPKGGLRWFGRPKKYEPGQNDLWLHLEVNDCWRMLQLRTDYYNMQRMVRAIKTIATPEQVKAYRRHRPYIHYGPVAAQPAEQDIYGVWTVHPQITQFYIMPLALVFLEGIQIKRTIPLEQIQKVEALRRMDAPSAEGVVRFRIVDEVIAYTVPDYVAFGAALAEAAKRSLEDPVMVKKKKDDDDDE